MSVKRIIEAWHDLRARLGNGPLVAGAVLLPVMIATGAALDFGMAYQARQKLDIAAQSAAAAAVAQSRALRAIHPAVQPEEMMERGRGRADMVFNAQKPNVRNVKTNFRLDRASEPNTFVATFEYEAAQPTVFLRVIGVRDLDLHGMSSATWVARDALIDDDFDEYAGELRAGGGRKIMAPVNGWVSNARTKNSGQPVMQLAEASRYGGEKPAQVNVAVELDAGVGNSFIAKKFYADPGLHQVRYWYREQARNEMIAPAWLCTTREDDLDWMQARDRSLSGNTSQLSVHLVPDSGKPPTSDIVFASGNRIDTCYSSGGRWIERMIKIDIVTRGEYWIAFHAEGKADGIGASVSNMLVCREPCANDDGTPRAAVASFPWRADEVLFEDRFTAEGANPVAGSPAQSKSGWDWSPSGWTVWPRNNVTYRAGNDEGPGYVELDVAVGDGVYENRAMGRPFLLVPGFYTLRYGYSTAASQIAAPACNYFSLDAALQRLPRVRGADTRRISVHIDSDFASLHPEVSGPGADERAEWFTPARVSERDLKSDRIPRLPILGNAVDFCADAPAGAIVPREITFKIDRAGIYWITFVGAGPADGEGGRISHVQLLARGPNPAGGLPRVVKGYDRNDALAPPPVGAWLPMPPSAGSRAAYKVQLQ